MEHLYNFVIYVSDEELAYYRETTIEDNLHLFSRWGYDWCLQPYLRLKKQSNLKVQLFNHLLPNCINIVHSAQLNMEVGKPEFFIVCARADFPKRKWAHFHLVQNQNQVENHTAFIPHWVQPGLIGRDNNRKGVTRVGYAGQVFNGNLAASEDDWKDLFAAQGIQFIVLPPEACYDLSDIDVLIGIRSFSKFPYDTKPASKLVNAWHAGIPFIGGYDSAFEQMGEPGKDYLRASTMDEVLNAVLALQKDSAFYQSIVENGNNKAKRYNDEATFKRWEEVLTGTIHERYEQWQKRRAYERQRFLFLTNINRVQTAGKSMAKRLVGVSAIQGLKRKLHRG